MIEMKCDIETLTENIEGIKKLDETELKILLYKSLWLKIMEHNDHELSTISNFKHNSTHTIIKLNKTFNDKFDAVNEFNSGKDLLKNQSEIITEEINLWEIDDDLPYITFSKNDIMRVFNAR